MPNDDGNKKDENKAKKKVAAVVEKKKHRHLGQDVRSSYDITLRYRIAPRVEGTQQSHSVRRIVAAPVQQQQRPQPSPRQKRLVVHQPEQQRRSHHHLDAVDFYYRSTAYGHRHKDGLRQFRHKSPLEDRRPRRSVATTTRTPKNRCRNCLELKKNCICILSVDRPETSDWVTLFTSHPERPRGFIKPRGDWLVTLEENSKIDHDKLAEEKFNSSREVCCFPFNTFRIFAKRDIELVDFYRKN